MTIYVIGYDLHPVKGETYEELIAAIKKIGSWWHCLDSTWLVQSDQSATQIRDTLWHHMRADDQLIVVGYAPPKAAWVGFKDDCQSWLTSNM